MDLDRTAVKKAFKEYTDRYDSQNPKVRLKIKHTYKTAEIADRIEKSETVTESDAGLGWLLGMLHDIGRFEQLRRYNTFFDAKSVDHAELGADILFKDGLIGTFFSDEAYYPLIEKAVRLHNKLALPADLNGRDLFFCNLIRDADKLDIFRVIAETPFEDLNEFSREDFENAAISDKVFSEAMAHRTVDRAFSKTPMDQQVNKISFIYGLTFKESFKIAKEQGFYDKLFEVESHNPETEERLRAIREEVRIWMGCHISS